MRQKTTIILEKCDYDCLIRELGGRKNIADILNISVNAVSMWRNKGIPRLSLFYLKGQFPLLHIWKKINI